LQTKDYSRGTYTLSGFENKTGKIDPWYKSKIGKINP